MNTYNRHRNNVLGQVLLERVGASVMRELHGGVQSLKLRSIPDFIAVPTAWGPPEMRLSFQYAGEVSQRAIHITEFAGASFFGVTYVLADRSTIMHYLPVTLTTEQQEVVRQALHKYLVTGSYVIFGYDALREVGADLRQLWMDGAVVAEAQTA